MIDELCVSDTGQWIGAKPFYFELGLMTFLIKALESFNFGVKVFTASLKISVHIISLFIYSHLAMYRLL